MSDLRIIFDKSVVFGLTNAQVDSLDRHFFLIVPSILINEIAADLAKESDDPTIKTTIARHSYRISGNRGIPVDHRTELAQSLLGNEVPMDGRFLPAGDTTVRSKSGHVGQVVETLLEDETISRWEAGEFTKEEREWSKRWREKLEKPIPTKIYTDHIAKAGLEFTPPKNDKVLFDTIDSLLQQRSLQKRFFLLLFKEYDITPPYQTQIIKRWFKEGTPMFKDFAPYAFYCIRAKFLWALALTNPNLFRPDKNDRKDLEYCYYLPHCEIFASNDNKHKRLVPYLLRSDQSFVVGDELKTDLKQLDEQWGSLSREEKIQYQAERGDAPPENENSKVFELWKKHRNELRKPSPPGILKAMVVDSSLPKEQQVPITFEEMLKKLVKQCEDSEPVSNEELVRRAEAGESDPRMFIHRTTKVRKDRLLKLYPKLTLADLEKKTDD